MPATSELPQAPAGLIPQFSPPPNLKLDPRLPEDENPSEPTNPNTGDLGDANVKFPFTIRSRKPEQSVTRTPTSDGTGSKGDPKAAAKLLAGLLGLVVVGAAYLVTSRTRRELRKPTPRQLDDISNPLGRILVRHADLSVLGPDLADLIEAGAATGAYLTDGPLTHGKTIESGIPNDLQDVEN